MLRPVQPTCRPQKSRQTNNKPKNFNVYEKIHFDGGSIRNAGRSGRTGPEGQQGVNHGESGKTRRQCGRCQEEHQGSDIGFTLDLDLQNSESEAEGMKYGMDQTKFL